MASVMSVTTQDVGNFLVYLRITNHLVMQLGQSPCIVMGTILTKTFA